LRQNPNAGSGATHVSFDLGSEDNNGSLLNSSARPDIDEIYMPPGDMEAAWQFAIVYLDPVDGFSSPSQSIGRALCRDMPHLQIELVPSGLGAMYARFHSHGEREAAIEYGYIFLDDVCISLKCKETEARVPADTSQTYL
jgi:hypothetical protein